MQITTYIAINYKVTQLFSYGLPEYIYLIASYVYILLNNFVIGTVISNVSTSNNDDDSVNVAVISGAAVGTLLLTIVIIIIMIVMITILCRRRKKSRRACNIDDKDITMSSNHQQHTHNTSGQSQHDIIIIIHGLQELKLILQLG